MFVIVSAVPAPLIVSVRVKVVFPVTPKVPPTVALPVTAIEEGETAPEPRVPVTVRLPPIVALLVTDKAVPVPDNVRNPVLIFPVAIDVPFP